MSITLPSEFNEAELEKRVKDYETKRHIAIHEAVGRAMQRALNSGEMTAKGGRIEITPLPELAEFADISDFGKKQDVAWVKAWLDPTGYTNSREGWKASYTPYYEPLVRGFPFIRSAKPRHYFKLKPKLRPYRKEDDQPEKPKIHRKFFWSP